MMIVTSNTYLISTIKANNSDNEIINKMPFLHTTYQKKYLKFEKDIN